MMGVDNLVAKHGSRPCNVEPCPNHLWCPMPFILIYHHTNASCIDKSMLGGYGHNQIKDYKSQLKNMSTTSANTYMKTQRYYENINCKDNKNEKNGITKIQLTMHKKERKHSTMCSLKLFLPQAFATTFSTIVDCHLYIVTNTMHVILFKESFA